MLTKTITLYSFDELSDKAKDKARDWWRDCESSEFGDFAEFNEPIETAAKLLGLTLKTHSVGLMSGKKREEINLYWTLHVQGAGASFDATYYAKPDALKAVREEFPKDEKLHNIAVQLVDICEAEPEVSAVISRDGRCHSLDVETDYEEQYSALKAAFEYFADWIYRFISAEWDWRMADENVDESIRANDYTFTADGKRED